MDRRSRGPRSRAFTLIELLAVLSIVALLIALLLPAVQSAREVARRLQCANNLKQVGLAMHGYHDVWQAFPAGYLSSYAPRAGQPASASELGPGWAWGTLILPFLEQRPLYDAANFDLGFGEPTEGLRLLALKSNRTIMAAVVSTFLCPSDGRSDGPLDLGGPSVFGAPGQYVASAGWLDSSRTPVEGSGVFSPNSRISLGDVRDGSASTLMIGERARDDADAAWTGVFGGLDDPAPLCTKRGRPVDSCVPLMFLVLGRTGPAADVVNGEAPDVSPLDARATRPDGFASRHPAGCLFLACDGSTRLVARTVSREVFRALASRSGGEVVDAGGY
ncbi:MAG: hypothetical protein BGO49_07500 [Planctomycetales bacterium 71-10]|nr:MAG: hypothetical protein BGO49_07500 [Planctomycetales bacterium 71-10]